MSVAFLTLSVLLSAFASSVKEAGLRDTGRTGESLLFHINVSATNDKNTDVLGARVRAPRRGQLDVCQGIK